MGDKQLLLTSLPHHTLQQQQHGGGVSEPDEQRENGGVGRSSLAAPDRPTGLGGGREVWTSLQRPDWREQLVPPPTGSQRELTLEGGWGRGGVKEVIIKMTPTR